MVRTLLSDYVWKKVEAVLPGKEGNRGRTALDNRWFAVDRSHGRPLARSAKRVRSVVYRVHAFLALEAQRCLAGELYPKLTHWGCGQNLGLPWR